MVLSRRLRTVVEFRHDYAPGQSAVHHSVLLIRQQNHERQNNFWIRDGTVSRQVRHHEQSAG